MNFILINEKNITEVQNLAKKIWNENYTNMISQNQIDYMLDLMYSKEKITTELANGFIWKILKNNNKPIAYIAYTIKEDKIFLSKIYVDKSQQKKGIGKILLDDVYDFANQHNLKKVYLTVNKENNNAIYFYEKNGFKNIELAIFDIGSGYIMDDFIFEKNL